MPAVKNSSSGERAARRKVPLVEGNRHHSYPQVAISALPEDVLLDVFDFYLVESYGEDAWQTLVHVCKNWRCIVFASPQRLRLRLLCTNKRPIQNSLDVWPELPIVVGGHDDASELQDANNIIAALKQPHRMYRISISDIPNTLLEKIRAMEMDPFPVLTSLWLWSPYDDALALPDSFLGGSAPRLRTLELLGIPFPGLPKLLLSTRDLVMLSLRDISSSGYISPKAMVTGLSSLTRLQTLRLTFRSSRSWPNGENRRLPHLTRFVLPALTEFEFRGDTEYLEDVVAQIDTPRLDRLKIMLFNEHHDIFDAPLLRHFVRRTETLKLPHQAKMMFRLDFVCFDLARRDGNGKLGSSILSLSILCSPSDWQLLSLAQICHSALFPLPTIDRLEITSYRYRQEDMDTTQWLEILNLFTSMKDLILDESLIRPVALGLEDLIGEGVTEVLPALRNLFLNGPQPSGSVKKAIGRFIAARQLFDRPVIVHYR